MQRVFIPTGKVVHLLDESSPLLPGQLIERAPAVCNMKPLWPGRWFEAHTESSDLPLCKICAAITNDPSFVPIFHLGAADAGTA